MGAKLDLIDQKFGILVVTGVQNKRARNGVTRRYWDCLCDCGRSKSVPTGALRDGSTRSCGCMVGISTKSRFTTHGMYQTSEYASWQSMLARCRNPNSKVFKNYGGRGIGICERWISFENFLSDMGPKPSIGMTIERLDNNGNYEKSNCCWKSRYDQNKNKRMTSSNTSGITGVSWDRKNDKWRAYISDRGKFIELGRYRNINDAAAARRSAMDNLGFNPDHGK